MASLVERVAFRPPRPPSARSLRATHRVTTRLGHSVPMFAVGPVLDVRAFVVYAHGNSSDVDQTAPLVAEMARRLGVRAVVVEYAGYADTRDDGDGERRDAPPLTPSAERAIASVEAGVDFVARERDEFSSDAPVVVVGKSLGTGPAAYVAAGRGVDGVALVSGFTTTLGIVLPAWLAGALVWFDAFDNVDALRATRCAVAVVHGTADRLIDVEHARALQATAEARGATTLPPTYIEGAPHVFETRAEWLAELCCALGRLIDAAADDRRAARSGAPPTQ